MQNAYAGVQARLAMPEVLLPDIPEREFYVVDFGAVGDGMTDNSEAFRQAIEACAAAGGGKVVIPAGIWLIGPLALRSKLEIHAEAGALVLFSKRFDDYPLIMSSYEGRPGIRCQSPLDGEGLTDVAITGEGVFDGGGEAWRPVKKWKMSEPQWKQLIESGGILDDTGQWWPTAAAMRGRAVAERLQQEGIVDAAAYQVIRDYLRPNLLSLRNCKRILLDGPTFQNSAAWCLHPWASEHVVIRNVMVRNPWFAQNGDGLDLDSCRYGIVENCSFDVGDDAICMKSGKDEAGRELGIPCEYITIRGCRVYHGHGGFVIGSEMSGGVRHVHVSDCTFIGTDIGLRFKSARGRGGTVEHIAIERIYMRDIQGEAISFHMFYAGKEGSGAAEEESMPVSVETPVFRHIDIRNITCAGAQTALLVNGLPEMPLEGLSVNNMIVSSERGIVCNNVTNLSLRNLKLRKVQGPLLQVHQCQDVILDQVSDEGAEDELVVSGKKTKNIEWNNTDASENRRKVTIAPEVVHQDTIHW
ncbi:glycoside hydrolase family 28 protein [Paenibacillus sedimenti]|uniref:Glycoside hydrolase family 28 protein n=1 Tax=Paenibacillus sedimenti TaxID=2770274 RepID=A0A926QIN7_9BACL|nr:glycoside hydrolase family 28 protein [Paenibacillus sedimenti]MBD0379527.1 glycoside hydrolase family 28 protein [Paenibacillus sedimenti]